MEITLDTLINLLGLLLGGGCGAFFTWRWQRRKAAAEAMAQNSAMGPFGWISGLAAMASIIAAMATLPKFATGGIVGGTSYGGDRQLVRVNSGEMILNHQQQAQLWNAISSGSVGGGEVQFRIEGQQLVGVLNNYNSKYRKVR